MDIIQTATQIAAHLMPFFEKSKTIMQIGTEIGQAADSKLAILWNKVKPWFIKAYEEEKPINETFETEDIKALIKAELNQADEETKTAIEQALKQQNVVTSNITQTQSGTGHNVAGDTINNNNTKIGQQNNNSTVINNGTNFTQ